MLVQFHGTLIWHLVIFLTWLNSSPIWAVRTTRSYGSFCRKDPECKSIHPLIRCDQVDKQCLCPQDQLWLDEQCQSKEKVQRERAEAEEAAYVARLITILIPVIGGVIFLSCVAFMLCYWLKLIANTEQKVVKDTTVPDSKYKNSPEDPEDPDESEEDSEESSQSDTDSQHIKMTTIKIPPRRSISEVVMTSENERVVQGQSGVPQLKINGIQETTFNRAMSCPEEDKSQGQLSGTHTPVISLVGDSVSQVKDSGYQASMKQFLAMAHSPFSEPATRPVSARFISNSRPSTARVQSAALLMPRGGVTTRAASAGRLSPSIVGPYLSDPSKFRSRPTSPKPMGLKPENLTELYDKIAAVAVHEEKVQDEVASQKKKSLEFQGQEEGLAIVRVAASKFKQRRNMKKLAKSRKKGKGKKLETLVDQVMKLRLEDDKVPKPILRKHMKPFRRDSTGTDSVGSSGSSRPSFAPDGSRPESVAVRVLRERQAKKITAKTPVTAHKKPRPSVERKLRQKQEREKASPLYKALRESATMHHSSKEQLKEKIKQQVHLNAVRNYQGPPIEILFDGTKDQQKPKSILKKVEKGSGPPSALKSNGTQRSGGEVNYACEGTSDEENLNPSPSVTNTSSMSRPTKKVTHSAEVYTVHSG